MKYVKKPVVVEAFQLTLDNMILEKDWPEWLSEARGKGLNEPGAVFPALGEMALSINTLEGRHKARAGDWLIRGVKGEIYPCKPDIFDLTYEAADEDFEPEDTETGRALEMFREQLTVLHDSPIESAKIFARFVNEVLAINFSGFTATGQEGVALPRLAVYKFHDGTTISWERPVGEPVEEDDVDRTGT